MTALCDNTHRPVELAGAVERVDGPPADPGRRVEGVEDEVWLLGCCSVTYFGPTAAILIYSVWHCSIAHQPVELPRKFMVKPWKQPSATLCKACTSKTVVKFHVTEGETHDTTEDDPCCSFR